MLETAYDAWAADVRDGRTSVLVAAASQDVTALNARARAERVANGDVAAEGIELHDGNLAGVGDWIVTRSNNRRLLYGRGLGAFRRGGRWVHNGDTWRVTRQHTDGSLTLRHLDNRGKVRLPAAYVEHSVELAYAATAHRVQGTTTDTAHALVTPEMTREALYVASTRGRHGTTWYTATETPLDADGHDPDDAPRTPNEVLCAVLARTGTEGSATATIRKTIDEATSLRTLVGRYLHARTEAMTDVLHDAAEALPPADRRRVLNDAASPQLARTLAAAAARGAEPRKLLRTAFDFDDTHNVCSLAAVLASRIDDHPHTFCVPDQAAEPAAAAPLPWLPAPDVGHPGWLPYLEARAALIRDRAAQLGTLTAAYRDQYAITDPDPRALGEAPEPGSRREAAYRAALASQPDEREATRREPHEASPPGRGRGLHQRGPHLTR